MDLRPLGLAVLLAALPAHAQAPAPADAPTATDLEIAKAHYRTGELNYERGSYPDAAKEFEEAYRLSSRPELLYNMGKAYDGAGDMRGALGAYRRFLVAVKDSPDRVFCAHRIGELELLISHLEVAASVAGASVVLDSAPLGVTPLAAPRIEVNPGTHSIEIAAEGYATFRRTLKLERAQTEKIDAQMVSLVKVIHEPEKRVPVYKRWYLWTALGLVVVAGAVTGGVLGARAANAVDGPSLQLPRVQAP